MNEQPLADLDRAIKLPTVTINAPRQTVWQFLTNPEQLTQCAPGLESLEVITPNEKFRAVASIGFGAVKARFVTDVEWVDLDPPNRARMKVRGKAPVAREGTRPAGRKNVGRILTSTPDHLNEFTRVEHRCGRNHGLILRDSRLRNPRVPGRLHRRHAPCHDAIRCLADDYAAAAQWN